MISRHPPDDKLWMYADDSRMEELYTRLGLGFWGAVGSGIFCSFLGGLGGGLEVVFWWLVFGWVVSLGCVLLYLK